MGKKEREVSCKGGEAAPGFLSLGSLCWGVGEISDLAASLDGLSLQRINLCSQKLGSRDLDTPALPAGSRCLWSWGVPWQWGQSPSLLGVGRKEAGPVLGGNL